MTSATLRVGNAVVVGLLALTVAACNGSAAVAPSASAVSDSPSVQFSGPSDAFGGDGCGTPGTAYLKELVGRGDVVAVIRATVSQSPTATRGGSSNPVPASVVPVTVSEIVVANPPALTNGDVKAVVLGAARGVNPLPPGDYLMLIDTAQQHLAAGEYGTGIEETFVINGDSVRQRCPSAAHSEAQPALLPGGSGQLNELEAMFIAILDPSPASAS